MGIDGNFVGGFAQGLDSQIGNLRQDRRQAHQNEIKQKLINDDKTANIESARLNQRNRALEKYGQGLFALQSQQQASGLKRLQGIISPESSGIDSRIQNLSKMLQNEQRNFQSLQSRQAGAVGAGGGIDQILLEGQGGNQPSRSGAFGKLAVTSQAKIEQLRKLLGTAVENRGSLDTQINSRAEEIKSAISIDDVLNSREARVLQQSLGLSDDDISQFRSTQQLGDRRSIDDILGSGFDLGTPPEIEASPERLNEAQRVNALQRIISGQKDEIGSSVSGLSAKDLNSPSIAEEVARSSAIDSKAVQSFTTTLKTNPEGITQKQLNNVNALTKVASSLSPEAVKRINDNNPQDGTELSVHNAISLFSGDTIQNFRAVTLRAQVKEETARRSWDKAKARLEDVNKQIRKDDGRVGTTGRIVLANAKQREASAEKNLDKAIEETKQLQNLMVNMNFIKNKLIGKGTSSPLLPVNFTIKKK